MANRSTRFILKNNANSAAPFSGATLFAGEPIVNTAAGIMMFSGVTSGTNDWVPAGAGVNGNFFEVGSNLYNLKIRNQITSYSGVTNLSGKFLSGTTNGFVLADVSSIAGVDTYVTNFSYNNNNVLTLVQNQAGQTFNVLIDQMSGLTVNGTLKATTISATTYQNLPTDVFTTGATYSNNTFTFTNNTGGTFNVLFNAVTGLTVNGTLSATTANFGTENVTTLNATGATITTLNAGTENVTTLNATGGTITTLGSNIINVNTLNVTGGSITTAASNPNDIVNYSSLTAYTQNNDIYVTGGTISYTGPNGSLVLKRRNTTDVTITGLSDIYLTGGTYAAGTLTLRNNNNGSFNVTGLTSTDTYVTGFTYSPTTNTFTIKQNQGQADLPVEFNTVSGLTISNLTAGRVVYVGTNGLLTDEAGFTYDAGTNTFSVPSDGTVNVGTGGLNVAGNAVIQGSLTVFGPSVSAFTSELYVEDPNITLNYNPTGNTTATSIGSGWMIQDGNGVKGGNVNLNINRLDTLTGLTASNIPNVSEYTSSTGYANRGWITQLNDIVIRSTNVNTPNGVRVLAEFDTLDGGVY